MGLCFYMGTTVAGAMYILGAVETLKLTFPALVIIEGEVDECGKVTELNDYRLIGAIILVLCTCLVGGGVKYVSIVSPLFLIPVIVSIAWTSWFKMASTLFEDTAPSARLVPPRAQAAPTHPRAQPEPLGSLPWPQELASGRPKVEDLPLSTSRRPARAFSSPSTCSSCGCRRPKSRCRSRCSHRRCASASST